MSELGYEVLVLDGTPRAGGQRLPSGEPIVSSPLSVTLISGERDAVLVDAPYTFGQVERVRDWIIDSGKRLQSVYITHGHGDHWLGVAELLVSLPESARSQEFAGTPVYATPGTLRVMAAQATDGRAQLWDRVFPGLIPPSPLTAEPVPDNGLELEGRRLEPLDLGHTDTDETTALWVSSAARFSCSNRPRISDAARLTSAGGVAGAAARSGARIRFTSSMTRSRPWPWINCMA